MAVTDRTESYAATGQQEDYPNQEPISDPIALVQELNERLDQYPQLQADLLKQAEAVADNEQRIGRIMNGTTFREAVQETYAAVTIRHDQIDWEYRDKDWQAITNAFHQATQDMDPVHAEDTAWTLTRIAAGPKAQLMNAMAETGEPQHSALTEYLGQHRSETFPELASATAAVIAMEIRINQEQMQDAILNGDLAGTMSAVSVLQDISRRTSHYALAGIHTGRDALEYDPRYADYDNRYLAAREQYCNEIADQTLNDFQERGLNILDAMASDPDATGALLIDRLRSDQPEMYQHYIAALAEKIVDGVQEGSLPSDAYPEGPPSYYQVERLCEKSYETALYLQEKSIREALEATPGSVEPVDLNNLDASIGPSQSFRASTFNMINERESANEALTVTEALAVAEVTTPELVSLMQHMDELFANDGIKAYQAYGAEHISSRSQEQELFREYMMYEAATVNNRLTEGIITAARSLVWQNPEGYEHALAQIGNTLEWAAGTVDRAMQNVQEQRYATAESTARD